MSSSIIRNDALVETRDYDGDVATGTIRIDTDGISVRDSSDNWVTVVNTTAADEYARFSSNLTTTNEYRQSISADLLDRLSSRRYDIFNNSSRPNYSPENLVIVDIKVENIGDYKFKTIVTYIDTKNYQEVTQEYMSSVTMTQNFSISGEPSLDIKIEQNGTMQETRKDI